jgi:hypothetical protein
MLYIDLKYISILKPYLRNFKQKKNNLFNCSCPICGDSQTKKTKARGFFYEVKNCMYYKCHNCAISVGIGNFLKTKFPNYYDQYILEKYRSGVDNKTTNVVVSKLPAKIILTKFDSKFVTCIRNLDDHHYAKQYVINRKIPSDCFSRIYFTEDFSQLVEDLFPEKYPNLQKKEPRLVIPFFNKDHELIGLQGRSFSPETSLRYITIRSNSSIDLVFGIEKFNSNKIGYVVEGPIDSLFIPNCLAAANSDLESVIDKVSPTKDLVLVYDNEPRNKELIKLIETSIKNNRKVCIWGSNIKQKDINDMILSGISPDEILEIIKNRTFSGLEAQLELSKWKKV